MQHRQCRERQQQAPQRARRQSRRRPLRLAAALLAIAVALAAWLTLDSPSQAQTPTTRVLVSTIQQTDTLATVLDDFAQSFTTGADLGGYNLSSVDLKLITYGTALAPTVKLFSGSANGTEVATLTLQGSLTASTTANYTFLPTESVTLDGSTDYWVVVTGGNTGWRATTSDALDSGSLTGWSVDDAGERRAVGETGAFTAWSDGRRYSFRINGYANSRVLVSNFDQAQDNGAILNVGTGTQTDVLVAQEFTTGPNAGGYSLTAIDLRLRISSGKSLPTVTLRSGSATGAVLATLTGTVTASDDIQDITFAPSTAYMLTSGTDYWVVAEGGGGTIYRTHADDDEDEDSAPGWSIANTGRQRNAGSTALLTTAIIKIQVKGTIIVPPNQPATGTPEVVAVNNVYRVPAELIVDFNDVMDGNGKTKISETAVYTWKRYDGATVENDNIGTGASYTLTDDDVGKTIRLDVTFTDDHGYTETLTTSVQTPVVTAAATCAAPTLEGGAESIWTVKVGLALSEDTGLTEQNDSHFAYLGGILVTNVLADAPALNVGTGYTLTSLTNGRTYTVGRANLLSHTFAAALAGTAPLGDSERSQLSLYVCDQSIAFGDAAYSLRAFDMNHVYTWTSPEDIDWSTHAERTVYIVRDQVAPMIESAIVDGTTLTLTFNEDLGDAANLANTAFTVKKSASGTETTVTLDSNNAPSISGKTLTLTLDTAVTATDTGVTVSYAKPATGMDNKLVDKFGNEADSFTDEDVGRPNVPHTGTPTIAAPNVFRVPAELYVDFSTIMDDNGTENIEDMATYTWKALRRRRDHRG